MFLRLFASADIVSPCQNTTKRNAVTRILIKADLAPIVQRSSNRSVFLQIL